MPEMKTVRAPYNFVPFHKKILIRYTSFSDLPSHDRIESELLSGELQVAMTADTPVFVSDGGKSADGKKQDLHFFRLPNGAFAIPGSTVRGMVRENMQILGFGLVRPGIDLEDYQIYFREIASARESVGNNVKQYYHTALGIQSGRSPESGKTYSLAKNVQSGYLCNKSGKYLIYPTKEPYYRVSRKHPDVWKFDQGDARAVPVAFTAGNDRIKAMMPINDAHEIMQRGMLLFTGPPVGKQNHLYLFPEADETAEALVISEEDILSFKEDFEARRNSLKGLHDCSGGRSEAEWLSFWMLPDEGERKPVFYIRWNGHLYFGMSQFLRIGYPHTLSEGLPKHHKEILAKTEFPLDYPNAILGFAWKNDAYRSRVSFGDFTAEPSVAESTPVSMILNNPKPSFYPGYVRDGKDYTEDGFELRGYKHYWFKNVIDTQIAEGKERVKTTIRPLPEGTAFRGTIRFVNLTEDELGLLLWSLRLNDGCYQSVGMGKPLGYGRMRLTIRSLALLDLPALYGRDIATPARRDATVSIPDFIRNYDDYAAKKLYIKKPASQPSITSQPEIQDFFFMKSAILSGQETSYMELSEYNNIRSPLPSVAGFRERRSESSESVSGNPFEALKQKFGPVL